MANSWRSNLWSYQRLDSRMRKNDGKNGSDKKSKFITLSGQDPEAKLRVSKNRRACVRSCYQ